MKRYYPIICFVLIAFYGQKIHAQNSLAQVEVLQTVPEVYAAKKIDTNIHIDGKMDSIWNIAPWSADFIDIEGANKQKPKYKTRFKMLWDQEYLYIYAKLEEPHIWGILTQHDAIIYNDNDFEVFLKPKLSSPVYYEIEINTLNTIMDLMMPKPYRFGGHALLHWDTKKLKSAVHIEGTLNNPADTDNYWAVEMAIPFQSLQNFGSGSSPKLHSYWRINFSRVQWQHDIQEGKYARKIINGKHVEENNWVWSPIGLVNMHYPEKWGFIHFVQDKESTALPSYYEIEKTAWNIYYLQQIYKNKHKQYTSDLKDLEGYESLLDKIGQYSPQLTVSKNHQFYHVILKEKNSKYYFSIDSQGNYTTNYE